MFTIPRTQLMQSLEKIRERLCAYFGTPCDCKYVRDGVRLGHETGGGCPEVRLSARIFAVMTDEEYARLLKRAEK